MNIYSRCNNLPAAYRRPSPITKTRIPDAVCQIVSGAAASSPQKWETRIRIGTLTIFEKIAIGMDTRNKTVFFVAEVSIRYANTDPSAMKAIRDRRPLHGFPTSRVPAGMVMLNPSRITGIPNKRTKSTPVLATSIFNGKETAEINAMGTGNMKIKNISGKRMIRVIFFPKRNRQRPMTKKNMENPEIEKT